MVFSAEDRILIKVLRKEKGFGAKRLVREFPGKSSSSSSFICSVITSNNKCGAIKAIKAIKAINRGHCQA